MNREEKKEWFKKHKDKIKLEFDCISLGCYDCPYNNKNITIAGCEEGEFQKESEDIMLEVLAEEHGYIKMPVIDFIIPDKFYKPLNPINPDHYKAGKLQTIEQMIIAFGPNKVARFCEVNSYKYHARAGLKGDAVLDHKKADWYMRLYERLSKYSSDQTAKALEEVRKFLKEEEEENDRLRNKHERDNCECAG